MRVLILTNLFPSPVHPHRATFNRAQFAALARSHEVRVICPIAWTDELRGKGSIEPGRSAEVDGVSVDYPRYWFPPKILRQTYGRLYAASVAQTFRTAVGEFRPDVVLGSWAYPDGWAAIRLAREANLPVAVKVHGSDLLRLNDRHRLEATRKTLADADRIIAVSDDLRSRAIVLGAEPQKVRVVRNGVDRSLFTPGDRAAARQRLGLRPAVPIVLFVGNLAPVKRLDILLQAIARQPGVALHLIGGGPLRDRLVTAAAQLGIGNRCVFHGPMFSDRLPDWYRAATLLALPSDSEGLPNVLLEAIACDCTFVASNVGGIPEIAALGRGELVPPGDAAALNAAMSRLIAAPPVSPGGRAEMPGFEQSAAQLAGELAELTAGHRGDGELRGRDIVCFSNDWSGDPLSKMHIMRILARDNRVLWINSIGLRSPSVSASDARRAFRKLIAAFRSLHQAEPNLWVFNPLAIPIYHRRWALRLNAILLRLQLRRAMRRLDFRRVIEWSFLPSSASVAGTLGEELLIYHCVDEFSAFRGVAGRAIAESEQSLLRRADIVLVSAEPLLEAKRPFNAHVAMVRHGVDWHHFRRALDPDLPVAEAIAYLPHPVIGYFGLLSDDWIDPDLLLAIARKFSGGSLVLIGKSTMDLSALQRLSNVHVIGREPYASLPGYCKGFDVAIIPFRVSPLTHNANPLKMREYLAAGLPVVSTPMPEVESLGLCRVAGSANAFLAELEAALRDPGPSAARSDAVREQSWEARVDEIRGHVAEAMRRKGRR